MRLLVIILASILFVTYPKTARAQILINEVSPASCQEWVELFNISSSNKSLSEYSINFGTDSQTLYFCDSDSIDANGYKLIYLTSSWLYNSGDVVTLKNGDDLVDSIGYGTGYSLGKPNETSSITRSPDGSSNWIITSEISPTGDMVSFDCPTPTPSQTPAPTDTPSYKAVYKINSPKDGGNNILTGVQIYVDGKYVHHKDEEILSFYNGHECYSEVDCSLGVHTISLRKTDYNSWEDTRDFTAGSNFEVNPVLILIETPTPNPTVSVSLTPKPTIYKTSSPSAQVEGTSSGSLMSPAILGINNNDNEADETSVDATKHKWSNRYVFPLAIITVGVGFIGYSIFSIIRNAKKEDTKLF